MNSEDSACVRDAAISHMNSVGQELYEAAEKFNSFAVAYKLAPFRDGNQWCVLLGSNIQDGVAGFGDTPAKAIADFERQMHTPIATVTPAAQAVADDVVRDAERYRWLRKGGWEVMQDPRYWTPERKFDGAIQAGMDDVKRNALLAAQQQKAGGAE